MSAPDPVLLRAMRPQSPVLWYHAGDDGLSTLKRSRAKNRGRQGGHADEEDPAAAAAADRAVYALPATLVDVAAEFHVATAFVTVTCCFVNTASHEVSALFALPTRGTVTAAEVRVGEHRLVETVVVPQSSADQLTGRQEAAGGQTEAERRQAEVLALVPHDNPNEAYVPDLFRLAVHDIKAGETVRVTVSVMEALRFAGGSYHYALPLTFAPGTLPAGAPLAEVVRLTAAIHSVAPNVQFSSTSHDLMVLEQRPFYIKLQALHNRPESAAFDLAYFAPSMQILAGLMVEPPAAYSADPRGSFALVVTPPTEPMGLIARNVIFVLDRSGSMHGQPFAEASRALGVALDSLGPQDSFNIVAFDDQQAQFSLGMVPATPHAVAAAKQFVAANPPRGLTDIATPLLWSLDLLAQQAPVDARGLDVVPFVVLVTDGCVHNERDICRTVAARAGRTRVSTFGIGSYANHYFLKMLAMIGRGFDVAVAYQEEIFPEMTRLMQRQAAAVLTDVVLRMPLDQCEVYPFPVPDLFVGEPLTVSGKFSGQFPASIFLEGRLPSGRPFRHEVFAAAATEGVPVGRIFVKQRIDALVARQWLEESEELRKQVEQLSVEESYPSPFTSMVAYETTVERKAEEERKERERRDKEAAKGGKGGKDAGAAKPVSGASRAGKVAAIAVGGAVVVGAAFYAFGDTAATAAGLSAVGSAGGNAFSALTEMSCCADLANCVSCGSCPDCSCFQPCLEVPGCGCVGDACSWLGDAFGGGCCSFFGETCSFCSPACDWIGGACGGGICEWVGGALDGGACSLCSSCMEPVCGCLGHVLNGGCCEFVGGAVQSVGGVLGDGIQAIGGCLGGCDLGDACGAICECLGSVLGALGDL